jgi:protein-L-isoaspartate(D-aspartate) O-methyltransferase
MPNYAELREAMVRDQLIPRGIADARVLDAMRTVPRHEFVLPELAARAYEDGALPIAAGQTISQPYIVALMAETLRLDQTSRVLEVGTGSGYAAAVLSRLCRHVYSVELHAELADAAAERLLRLGYHNVTVRAGNGWLGWPEEAPFDAISVPAGSSSVPEPLPEQLAIGGRLVIPIGPGIERQQLLRITRSGPQQYEQESLGPVSFVPLINVADSHTANGEQ